MKQPNLYIKAIAPIASFTLGMAGIIQLRAQFRLTGGLCLLMAMLGIIYSIRILERNPLSAEELGTVRSLLWKALGWAVVAILLTFSVIYVIDTVLTPATDRVAEVAWIGSILLGLFLATWQGGSLKGTWGRLEEFIKAHRLEILLVVVIVDVALNMRFIGLEVHPYPWSGDEASIGVQARRILNGEITNYFDMGWSSQSNWSFFPTAITERLFGQTIFAVRMTSALAGALAVLFTYLAARELFHPGIALAAGAFLAVLPYNVHFSRIGVNNIIDSFMSALMFWLLARGIRKDDHRYYYGAGLVSGLTIYTYAGTRLVILLGVATICFLAIRQRDYLRSHWRHVTAYVTAAMVSAAPLAAYFVKNPNAFMGRMGQEGIFFNGWLAQQTAQTGKSALDILFTQFSRTILVFISSPTPGSFFNSPRPYLTLFGSALFLIGMCYALAYFLDTKYFIILVWFWATIFFGGVLTLNPPANTRLLMTTPALAILMAVGVYNSLEFLSRFKLLPAQAVTPLVVLSVIVIGYQDIKFYMGDYYSNWYFQDANGEFAMETGLMARDLGGDYRVYIMGAPRIFAGFPTTVFINPNDPGTDLTPESIPTLDVPPGRGAVFFAIPDNDALLRAVMEKYPGGKQGEVHRRPKPEEVLFEYYVLDH